MVATAQFDWFFTAPWEPVYVRRGDALGLRGLNDALGDLLAPDLTNRTQDARWISILSWCLVRSYEVWVRAESDVIQSREAAAARYAWLRPLELMWVARTLELTGEDARGRQLPGQRRVRAWLRDERASVRFGMTQDQYRNHRQGGAYGAYRTLFRSLPLLTRGGDGWTPAANSYALATAIDKMLGSVRVEAQVESERKLRKNWQGKEDKWWLKTWPQFAGGSARSLPQKRQLLETLEEAGVLRPVVFGDDPGGFRRSEVAQLVAKSRASDHQTLCEELADQLREHPDGKHVAMIPHFSRMADAGVKAMDAILLELFQSRTFPGLPLMELSRRKPVRQALDSLADAGQCWLASERTSIRHVESANRLAAVVAASTSLEQLQSLVQHHATFGGGVRWFALRDDLLEPTLGPSERPSSRYRFRLWPLARMAVQTAETRTMPKALEEDQFALSDELDDE